MRRTLADRLAIATDILIAQMSALFALPRR